MHHNVIHVYLCIRCAVGYAGNNPKKPLELLGSGVGTTEDIRQFCADDNAIYGYFRVVSLRVCVILLDCLEIHY